MILYLLVGNIGAGKSVLARKLARNGGVVVNMDDLQQSISGGEYGNYDVNKKEIYHSLENILVQSSLKEDFDTIIDRTNMNMRARKKFISMAKDFGARIICYDFGPGEQKNLARRLAKPKTMTSKRWTDVFTYMQKAYEKPSLKEGIDEILYPPRKYVIHAYDFDGFIVTNKFPQIGNLIPKNVELVKEHNAQLKNISILWTCREGDYLAQAMEFLNANCIHFDFINANPFISSEQRKIFAHKYYDDRNANID